MPTTSPTLTDVGPAPQPPAWCLPDAQPQWDRLTPAHGGGMIATWSREFGEDVWIAAEDRIIDGRVRRSAPRIFVSDAHDRDGRTCGQARELARALIAAADVLTTATGEEVSR